MVLWLLPDRGSVCSFKLKEWFGKAVVEDPPPKGGVAEPSALPLVEVEGGKWWEA